MANKFPILYGNKSSPSVRAVLLTLKALQVDYEFRLINLSRGSEQFSREYVKQNPARTIPMLEIENGRYIGDSHAIMAYLVGQYGKDDSLYPKELYKRAKVDELLHFENGVLFITCVKQSFSPIFAGLRHDVPPEKILEIQKAYDMLESYFGDNAFVAGEQMTIADFSCLTSVSSLLIIQPTNAENHPKLCAWLSYMRSLPYYEEIMENDAVIKTGKFLQKKLSKL